MEAVRRKITLQLGDFARTSLEEEAVRNGVALEAVIEDAAGRYLAGRDERRPSRRLLRLPGEESATRPAALGLDLGPAAWRALEEEAEAEGTALERVLEHAALLYLADRYRAA